MGDLPEVSSAEGYHEFLLEELGVHSAVVVEEFAVDHDRRELVPRSLEPVAERAVSHRELSEFRLGEVLDSQVAQLKERDCQNYERVFEEVGYLVVLIADERKEEGEVDTLKTSKDNP
jgi:hypothetical protein